MRHLRAHAKRMRAAGSRTRVVVGEIIDQLLHPHGIHRRQAAIIQKTAHIGVAAGVHVDAEGGNRLLRHFMHGVGADLAILFGIGRRAHDLDAGERRRIQHAASDRHGRHRTHRSARGQRPRLVLRHRIPGTAGSRRWRATGCQQQGRERCSHHRRTAPDQTGRRKAQMRRHACSPKFGASPIGPAAVCMLPRPGSGFSRRFTTPPVGHRQQPGAPDWPQARSTA